MIVPRTKLIVWTGLVLVPASLVWLSDPAWAVAVAAAILLFLVVAAVDAVGAYGSLEGVSGAFPEGVRFTKGRPGEVEVFLRHDGARRRPLKLALQMPSGIVSEQEFLATEIPEGATEARVAWPCTPVTRGRYALRDIYLEGTSPLGLWSLYRATPAETELHVYPNIQKEQKHVAAFFLNRGAFGIHAQRQVGKGREFEKLREYIPGDSFEDIHWKATARRGRPVTKDYQIERTQEVYVVIDSSRLSGREVPDENGGGSTTQLERFLASAMVLGLVAERQGDLFGLVSFQDGVQRFVRARRGKAHFAVCRDALYTLEARDVNPDFEEVCSFIRLRLRRRALLIFLTNLDDPMLAESFARNVDLLSRHHLVVANMVRPPGVKPLFSEGVAGVDDLYDHLSGHLQWRSLREMQKALQRHNVAFSLVEHADMTAQLVSQYVNLKQRQLL